MVFYRKYRPQTIDALDSETVRQTLAAVLLAKEIPHAFLFTGPKGLGKTSTARIIAKVVTCTNRKNGEYNPCNQCDACVSITKGINIDVLEIDGASNRGIDEIRDLREKVRLAPSVLKKKIYIIDEVHMLTTEAFNALLKTIEEPPSHVMFLFCTTEPQKVPPTILSRCFHIHFNRATDIEIVHSLERIVAGEKMQIDKEVLPSLASMADGGFRDAAKILEEVCLLAGGENITKEFVQEKLHASAAGFFVFPLFGSLVNKEQKQAITVIDQLTKKGVDLKYFISECLKALHELLLVEAGLLPTTNYQLPEGIISISEIKLLVDLFSKAYQETKFAVIPQLPLEIAVIQWCTSRSSEAEVAVISSAVATGKPTIQSLQRDIHVLKVQSVLNPQKEAPKKVQKDTHEQRSLPAKKEEVASLLENIIYKIKPLNHSVAALLRGCKITVVTDEHLTIEAAYKFHKDRLDERNTQEILGKILKEITGKELIIKVELKQKA